MTSVVKLASSDYDSNPYAAVNGTAGDSENGPTDQVASTASSSCSSAIAATPPTPPPPSMDSTTNGTRTWTSISPATTVGVQSNGQQQQQPCQHGDYVTATVFGKCWPAAAATLGYAGGGGAASVTAPPSIATGPGGAPAAEPPALPCYMPFLPPWSQVLCYPTQPTAACFYYPTGVLANAVQPTAAAATSHSVVINGGGGASTITTPTAANGNGDAQTSTPSPLLESSFCETAAGGGVQDAAASSSSASSSSSSCYMMTTTAAAQQPQQQQQQQQPVAVEQVCSTLPPPPSSSSAVCSEGGQQEQPSSLHVLYSCDAQMDDGQQQLAAAEGQRESASVDREEGEKEEEGEEPGDGSGAVDGPSSSSVTLEGEEKRTAVANASTSPPASVGNDSSGGASTAPVGSSGQSATSGQYYGETAAAGGSGVAGGQNLLHAGAAAYHHHHQQQQQPNNPTGLTPVYVHVNLGQTLSLRVGDKIQYIPGPATVRMVSEQNPPMPLSMNVPPGHIVQQIVDENGALRHVILSSQAPPPPPPPPPPQPPFGRGAGGGSTAAQPYMVPPGLRFDTVAQASPAPIYYPGADVYPAAAAAAAAVAARQNGPYRFGGGGGGGSGKFRMSHRWDRRRAHHHQQQQQQQQHHQFVQESAAAAAAAAAAYYAAANVAAMQQHQQQMVALAEEAAAAAVAAAGSGDSAQSDQGGTAGVMEREEMAKLVEMMCKMQPPEVLEVGVREALAIWHPLDCSEASANGGPFPQVDASEFCYELTLYAGAKPTAIGRYRCTSGQQQQWLFGLKPGSDYSLRLRALLEERGLQGEPTTPVQFRTKATVPERPAPPRLAQRMKTSLLLRWSAPNDNGSKIVAFHLEMEPLNKRDDDDKDKHEEEEEEEEEKKTTTTEDDGGAAGITSSSNNGGGGGQVASPSASSVGSLDGAAAVETAAPTAPAGAFAEVYSGPLRQFKVQKLQLSSGYRFRLAASNQCGKSDYSDVYVAYTSGAVPAQPEAPRLLECGCDWLSVEWPASSDADEYHLLMEDVQSGYGFLPVCVTSDCQHTVDGLQRFKEYRFRLIAANEDGQSNPSEVVLFKTLPGRPGAPDSLRLRDVKATTALVDWPEPADTGGCPLDEYCLELKAEEELEWRVVYTGSERECRLTKLRPGAKYCCRVGCKGAGGTSQTTSKALSFTVAPVVPGPVKCVSVVGKVKSTGAHIRWNEPDESGGAKVTDYQARLLLVNEQQQQQVEDEDVEEEEERQRTLIYHGAKCELHLQQLMAGRLYEVNVRAGNVAGFGPWSEGVRFKTAASHPDCPRNLRCVQSSSWSLLLAWDPPLLDHGSPVIEYRLAKAVRCRRRMSQSSSTASSLASASSSRAASACSAVEETRGLRYSPSPPYSAGQLTTTGRSTWTNYEKVYCGSALSYEVRSLQADTEYAFHVQAVNSVGASQPCAAVVLRTEVGPPACPVNVVGEALSTSQIMVSWEVPSANGSPITAYGIDISPVPDGGGDASAPVLVEARSLSSDKPYHTLHGLSADTAYRIRVRAANDRGWGVYCPPVRVATMSPPPRPPGLELATSGHNFLKLKWCGPSDDSRLYIVEMENRIGCFSPVYEGPAKSCKVSRLTEHTTYKFRSRASCKSGGIGPWSDVSQFSTGYTPPGPLKAPIRVLDVTETTAMVEWPPVKMTLSAGDALTYMVELRDTSVRHGRRESDDLRTFHRVPSATYTFSNLQPGVTYSVRVCAVRLCPVDSEQSTDGYLEVAGPSSTAVFTTSTVSLRHRNVDNASSGCSSSDGGQAVGRGYRGLTDSQFAWVILLGFTLVAAVIAYVIEMVIAGN